MSESPFLKAQIAGTAKVETLGDGRKESHTPMAFFIGDKLIGIERETPRGKPAQMTVVIPDTLAALLIEQSVTFKVPVRGMEVRWTQVEPDNRREVT